MRTKMKRIFFLISILCLASCVSQARHLVIIHTNDTHSHLDATRDGKWGVIERAAFIDSVRRAEGRRNVLLLHAGDFNQGSPYYTVLKGSLEVDLVNALEYDCIALGNHEFDNGIEDLTARAAKIKSDILCANYDFSSFELGRYVKPYTIIRRGGYKIGIIGLLTNIKRVVSVETADRIPMVGGSNAEVVNKWSSYLKNTEHCDLVLCLTHIGFNEDKELASQIHDVDAIIGGHSHTHISEPAYVTNADGKAIPIVSDWEWGKTMGLLKIDD